MFGHAGGTPGCVCKTGAGRSRGRLLPPQQPLRFQRRRDPAGRRLYGGAGRARAAGRRIDVKPMNASPHFAQTYAEARDKFLAAGADRGARMFRDVHPSERGVQGEELSIDGAKIGDDKAPALLLLTSGTHGVEGFCGSGCQVALLHDDAFLAAVERSGIAVLMLHALNPYGFSHLRRVNEDNVDLNRNFVDFAKPLPVNPAYAEIHSLLLPATWPPSTESEARLGAWVAEHGRQAYQAAVSIGQYAFPEGMFYGGSGPTWS